MNEPKNIALENIWRSPHRSSVMQANSPTSKLSGKIALVTGRNYRGRRGHNKKIRRPKEPTFHHRSQAAMGSRQTSENELKVRAIMSGNRWSRLQTELIKRY